MNIRSIYHKNTLPVFMVFLLCISVRVYWIGQKEGLYGDEQTSLALSYNVEGWGDKSYEEGRIYSANELRHILYIDDEGGWKGYVNDVKSLWTDNRDRSHASLYYMLLRTALIGQNMAEPAPVIWRGCVLNLVFFVISFVCLYFLSGIIFQDKNLLRAGVLLFAFCNPLSISNTLLLREYQLSECLLAAFSLMSAMLALRIKDKKSLFSPTIVAGYSLLTACVLSSGYFNSIFVFLVFLCLSVLSRRGLAIKNFLFLITIAVLSIAICMMMYRGFFNFITDERTAEVMTKVEGGRFLENVIHSSVEGIKMLINNMLGWLLCLLSPLIIAYVCIRKAKIERLRFGWLFVLAAIWIVLVLLLSTWKITRYIAPCVPIVMIAVSYYIIQATGKISKTLVAVPVLLFLLFSFSGKGIEYLMKRDEISSQFPDTKRLLLYATYADDRNTLPLLTPYLSDHQECLIISDPADIFPASLSGDSAVYVFADKNMAELRAADGFQSESPFNDWQDVYVFKRR